MGGGIIIEYGIQNFRLLSAAIWNALLDLANCTLDLLRNDKSSLCFVSEIYNHHANTRIFLGFMLLLYEYIYELFIIL